MGETRIDFETAIEVFEGPYLRIPSERNGEVRWIAVGSAAGQVVAVVCTERNERTRIISARMARTNERETYNKLCSDAS
ncbi:BrnT family toxin [Methylocystis iwaonis]|uniref:BrnT family toxin n=1 Tax=Methylocystis iwaonis TaxID=2885079 RepID=UPI002E7B6526|nr:BrnT family toxin [Methylocystis iwaonis]